MINRLEKIIAFIFLAFFIYSLFSVTPQAWINPLLTFLGIIVAARMVMYQQKENKRDEMRLRIFDEITQKTNETYNALFEAKHYLFFCRHN